MTVKQALEWGTKKLEKNSPSPQLDAEILLSYSVKRSKEFLYSYDTGILTWKQKKKFKKFIKLREKGIPVAYLTKKKEFLGLSFFVNRNVLVPRPETEIIVEAVINDFKDEKIDIVDVGTGSGIIAISLAKHIEQSKIWAIDISRRALGVAKKNTRKYGLRKRIKFLRGNLLKPILRRNLKNWILVANLPYLDIDIKDLPESPETKGLKFEPRIALYADNDGLDLYREMFKQLESLKHKPKKIYCEIGITQVDELKNIIRKSLFIKDVDVKKDLAGLDRVVVIDLK